MSILPYQTPIPRPAPLSELWWPLLLALLLWMLVPAAALSLLHALEPHINSSTTRAIGDYTPAEMAIMAISGSAAGFAALLIASGRLTRGAFDRVRISLGNLRAGFRQGIIAALIVVPLMFAVMQGTQWLWERIHYRHPDEHELLKAIGESSSPIVRVSLILSAILLAPAFEELMFRGYLQTALGATIARRLQRNDGSRQTRRRWPAILIASLAFTAVHEQPWLMPPIFFLSLCLGYLYERTGNLWAPMIVHATFNAVSTILFLYFR